MSNMTDQPSKASGRATSRPPEAPKSDTPEPKKETN